jgi:alkylhydroperoxidase family enzyme
MSDPDSTTSPSSDPRPRVAPGKGLELSPLALLASKIGSKVTGTDDVRLFSTLGRVRRLFPAWLLYSGMMMPFGILSRKETELVILRVSHLRGSAYERNHHEHLGARIGLTSEEIIRTKADPRDAVWTARTAAMLLVADELVDSKDVYEETWSEVSRHLDERELVGLVMLVTQYDGLATTLHTLRVQLDNKS